MAQITGLTASFSVGGTVMNFTKVEAEYEAKMVNRTNPSGGGARILLPGVRQGRYTFSGPYDAGAMPLTVASTNVPVTVVFTFIAGITQQISGFIAKVAFDDDFEDGPHVKVTFESSGGFTGSVA